MTFLWPELLWLLLILPALVLVYLWLMKRKKQMAIRYASLAMVSQALAGRSLWRRHLPPALFLLALTALLLASARPFATIRLPSQQETIMLAMDVSGSMRATDVEPNRLVAAQNAAKAFLAELPRHVKVGIVAFAGTASVVQPATLSREDLVAAIDKFQMQRGTAIGNGIVMSLAELFPDADIDLAKMQYGSRPSSLDDKAKPGKKVYEPVAPGSNGAAAVILLTDGQRTTGVEPLEAAKLAADYGVKVYTVGVGTVTGETIGFEGWSMRVRLDEETLKAIAAKTQAEYFYAGTAQDLNKVYTALSSKLTLQKKETEISGLMALLGAALALLSAGLSVLWFNRLL
jgi:Ca-activated chloride channel family protein